MSSLTFFGIAYIDWETKQYSIHDCVQMTRFRSVAGVIVHSDLRSLIEAKLSEIRCISKFYIRFSCSYIKLRYPD